MTAGQGAHETKCDGHTAREHEPIRRSSADCARPSQALARNITSSRNAVEAQSSRMGLGTLRQESLSNDEQPRSRYGKSNQQLCSVWPRFGRFRSSGTAERLSTLPEWPATIGGPGRNRSSIAESGIARNRSRLIANVPGSSTPASVQRRCSRRFGGSGRFHDGG